MQARTEASQYSEGSRQKYMSSRLMMLGLLGVRTVWYVVRTDGTVDRWASGCGGTIVQTAEREPILLTAESSEILLNSGIPCKTASLHTSDFVQTE